MIVGKKNKNIQLIPEVVIENKILLIRGKKVMLDRDLAELYGVETKQLTRQVRRNIERFPEDFMFKLNTEEYVSLRRQFGTLKRGRHSKYLPYVFTEQGVSMLSGVLHSPRAIQVNIAIMRVFVKLKEMVSTHKEIMLQLEKLERKVEGQDRDIILIFKAIRQLMTPVEETPKRKIGFHSE